MTLTGSGFRSTLSLAQVSGLNLSDANGQSVTAQLAVQSGDKATVTLPASMSFGKYALTLTQDGESQQITLFSNGGKTDYPVFTAGSDKICIGEKFYDETGTLREGTKVCNLPLPDCSEDGAKACTANAAYTAAATNGLADNVVSGKTVAGIAGNLTLPDPTKVHVNNGPFGVAGSNLTPTLAECASDGGINCVAVASYPAAKLANFSNGDIRSGVTVAGIAGSATAESHVNCSADGATGCITVSTYKAADMTQVIAGNIKSSVTIAGVVGAYPSVTYPLPSASATTDLASLAATTAAGSYEWWGSDGSRYTGAITDAGTITPTTSNQTFNASLYRQFTVAGDANLVASKIKSGVSIFGVTGDYPSATNPLVGADSTADLDLATFDAKIKSATNFEWFSADGTRYQNAGDADITAANIANGVTIFGATGTLQGAGTIDPWNVRAGVTIAGVAGALKTNCRNTGNRTYFNYDGPVGSIGTAGVTTGTTYEYWDTIDDYYGFPANKVAAWSSDTLCDSSVWQDVTTTNGGTSTTTCASGTCIYKDKISNLQVTGILAAGGSASNTAAPGTFAWNTALSTCNSSTYGGYAAGTWRLPTQKELMSMYEHGITSLDSANFISLGNMQTARFWSSSTYSYYTTYAWNVYLASGPTNTTNKTNTYYVICVR